MMQRVLLVMGGNRGDVEANMLRARRELETRGCRELRASRTYESEPWGFSGEVAKFLNQAVVIETELPPEALLDVTQSVEQEVGRNRSTEASEKEASGERYASRVIDIDIILYDEVVMQSERLTIPHPLMAERRFVLEPAVEIAAEWRNGVTGLSCREMFENLTIK